MKEQKSVEIVTLKYLISKLGLTIYSTCTI